jgi:hypothetical protein
MGEDIQNMNVELFSKWNALQYKMGRDIKHIAATSPTLKLFLKWRALQGKMSEDVERITSMGIDSEVFSKWLIVEKQLLDITTQYTYFFPYNVIRTSISELKSILIPEIQVDEDELCPICLCTVSEPMCCIQLPCCNSMIHPWCLQDAIAHSVVDCPMCRTGVYKITSKMSQSDCLKWYVTSDLSMALRAIYKFFAHIINHPLQFTPEYTINYCAMQYMAIHACLEFLHDTLNMEIYTAYTEKLQTSEFFKYVVSNCMPRIVTIHLALNDPEVRIHSKMSPLKYPMVSM